MEEWFTLNKLLWLKYVKFSWLKPEHLFPTYIKHSCVPNNDNSVKYALLLKLSIKNLRLRETIYLVYSVTCLYTPVVLWSLVFFSQYYWENLKCLSNFMSFGQ